MTLRAPSFRGYNVSWVKFFAGEKFLSEKVAHEKLALQTLTYETKWHIKNYMMSSTRRHSVCVWVRHSVRVGTGHIYFRERRCQSTSMKNIIT